MNVGNIIRKTREVYGMSISELAKQSGVSAAKIKAQENDTAMLGVEDLLRVDRIFDHDVLWELMGEYDSLTG